MQMAEEVKRVKAFSSEEVNNYIINAPDDLIHLPKKNVIIFGVSGFGRIEEVSSIMDQMFLSRILKEFRLSLTEQGP